jgi:hypothetical protein
MAVCGAALNTNASAALSTELALYDMDLEATSAVAGVEI